MKNTRLTQLPNAVPKHLVLTDEHLRLGLVKGALVAAAEGPQLAAVRADGRGAQPRRGVPARGPGPVAQVGASHVERAAREDGRARQ